MALLFLAGAGQWVSSIFAVSSYFHIFIIKHAASLRKFRIMVSLKCTLDICSCLLVCDLRLPPLSFLFPSSFSFHPLSPFLCSISSILTMDTVSCVCVHSALFVRPLSCNFSSWSLPLHLSSVDLCRLLSSFSWIPGLFHVESADEPDGHLPKC